MEQVFTILYVSPFYNMMRCVTVGWLDELVVQRILNEYRLL